MNQTKHAKFLVIAAGLALGAFAASAQTAPAADSAPPPSGLLGTDYAGVDYGYYRIDEPFAPKVAHAYGAEYNQNLAPNLDFTAGFTDTSASAQGVSARSDELLAGLTGFAPVNPWLKPFGSAQAGIAWEQSVADAGGVLSTPHSNRFDYVLAAGAEFQVSPAVVLTPTVSYQEVHRLDHDWNYAVRATYRFTSNWSVSLIPAIDQHRNLEYGAALDYRF